MITTDWCFENKWFFLIKWPMINVNILMRYWGIIGDAYVVNVELDGRVEPLSFTSHPDKQGKGGGDVLFDTPDHQAQRYTVSSKGSTTFWSGHFFFVKVNRQVTILALNVHCRIKTRSVHLFIQGNQNELNTIKPDCWQVIYLQSGFPFQLSFSTSLTSLFLFMCWCETFSFHSIQYNAIFYLVKADLSQIVSDLDAFFFYFLDYFFTLPMNKANINFSALESLIYVLYKTLCLTSCHYLVNWTFIIVTWLLWYSKQLIGWFLVTWHWITLLFSLENVIAL